MTQKVTLNPLSSVHPSVSAIILAGGKGTRLANLGLDIPKALISLGDKPLLHHTIDWVASHVQSIIIAAGCSARTIRERTPESNRIGIIEDSDEGTGKALLEAAKNVTGEHIIICNADTINDFNLSTALKEHLMRGKGSTICLTRQRNAQNAGAFRVSRDGQIIRSLEDFQPTGRKGILYDWKGASTGILIVPVSALREKRLMKASSLEQEIIPHLIDSDGLFAFDNESRLCLDVGTPQRMSFMKKNANALNRMYCSNK